VPFPVMTLQSFVPFPFTLQVPPPAQGFSTVQIAWARFCATEHASHASFVEPALSARPVPFPISNEVTYLDVPSSLCQAEC
jgi:hypothetical protein